MATEHGALAALLHEVPEQIGMLLLPVVFPSRVGAKEMPSLPMSRFARQFRQSGQEILKAADVLAHAAGFDLAGPPRDERARARRLGEIALDAVEAVVGSKNAA